MRTMTPEVCGLAGTWQRSHGRWSSSVINPHVALKLPYLSVNFIIATDRFVQVTVPVLDALMDRLHAVPA